MLGRGRIQCDSEERFDKEGADFDLMDEFDNYLSFTLPLYCADAVKKEMDIFSREEVARSCTCISNLERQLVVSMVTPGS